MKGKKQVGMALLGIGLILLISAVPKEGIAWKPNEAAVGGGSLPQTGEAAGACHLGESGPGRACAGQLETDSAGTAAGRQRQGDPSFFCQRGSFAERDGERH